MGKSASLRQHLLKEIDRLETKREELNRRKETYIRDLDFELAAHCRNWSDRLYKEIIRLKARLCELDVTEVIDG